MPAAAGLLLLRQYGPGVLEIVFRDGPKALAWVEQAYADGALEKDLAAAAEALERMLSLLGPVESLAEFVAAVNRLAPAAAQPEDPVMQRAAGHPTGTLQMHRPLPAGANPMDPYGWDEVRK